MTGPTWPDKGVDSYDIPATEFVGDQDYDEGALPDHIKARLAEKKADKAA